MTEILFKPVLLTFNFFDIIGILAVASLIVNVSWLCLLLIIPVAVLSAIAERHYGY